MLQLMRLGCVKAYGDLFQEILGIAAQLPVYRGNYPAQISPFGLNSNPQGQFGYAASIGFTPMEGPLGRDRLLIQAGTDRPSAIGRACIFSLLGNPNQINNKALVGYSTKPDNFFYIRPLFISQIGGKKRMYKKFTKRGKTHAKSTTQKQKRKTRKISKRKNKK
jgi:hypothetical protein